jgi:hypothetical protein
MEEGGRQRLERWWWNPRSRTWPWLVGKISDLAGVKLEIK